VTTDPAGGTPWPLSTLGAHFEVQLGKMLDSARNVGDPKPYLGNRAVQWGRIDLAAAGTVPLTKQDQARYRLRRNDLLVCEGGEVGRAAIWQEQLPECYYQKALHRLRPKGGFDPRVMMALLKYWSESGKFRNFVTQTSIAHLPRDKFLTIPLPEIPPREQQRIAKVLEDMEDLVLSLEKLIGKKEEVKRASTQRLFSGGGCLPGVESPWAPVAMRTLGSVYGGLVGKGREDFGSGSANYVPFMAVMSSVHVVTESLLRVKVGPHERQNVVKAGDLMFNISSETPEELAMCAVAGDLPSNSYLNSFCFGFRLREGSADPLFLAYLFRSGVGRSLVKALAQGATRYNMTRSQFAELVVHLPPIAEQRRIARVVLDAEFEIDALLTKRAKILAIQKGVMQELLSGRTRLPVGELVDA
jgi:type I restriction enzyme S subunit